MRGAELADALRISAAMVSRLASGKRKPSVRMMEKVEQVLGWSVSRQVDEMRRGRYAPEFKRRMERRRFSGTRSGRTTMRCL